MVILMATVLLFIFCLLVGVTSISPRRSRLSAYERQRQHAAGVRAVALDIRREQLFVNTISLQRAVSAVLLVILVVLLVAVFGWWSGCALALVVALVHGAIARIGLVHRSVQKLYNRHEASILNRVERTRGIVRLLGSTVPSDGDTPIHSREELQHSITRMSGIVSADEKLLLLGSLQFDGKTVREIMTPKSKVVSISATELLGPLVLDDLHKTGHRLFPVTDEAGRIIGVLDIGGLVTLGSKRTQTAAAAMTSEIETIRENQSLRAALRLLLREHQYMLIVANEKGDAIGMLALYDLIAALFGPSLTAD